MARVDADDDAAVLDAVLVRLGVLLGDARADEGAEHTARRAARTGSGEGTGERTGDGEAEARHEHRRADGRDRADDAADGAADGRARPGAFQGLRTGRAVGGLAAVMGLAGVVRHHDVDVVVVVAAFADGVVGTVGAVAIVVEAGNGRAGIHRGTQVGEPVTVPTDLPRSTARNRFPTT